MVALPELAFQAVAAPEARAAVRAASPVLSLSSVPVGLLLAYYAARQAAGYKGRKRSVDIDAVRVR